MRRTFTLIALLLGVNAAQAQIAFPSSFAVWTERHGQGEANPKFSIVGMKANDVTIGGVSYHKLYRSFDNATFEETEYIGGIREDAGKVYYYNASTSTEKLLYDFTLTVGDTITNPTNGAKDGVIHSIDIVTIGGVPHKKYNFRQLSSSAIWPTGAWLEGVGNTGLGGLLGSPMAQPTCDCATNTVCFSQSSAEVYKNANYPSIMCGTVVETPTVTLKQTDISILPNPVTGNARLLFPADEHFTTLTVYNMAGQKVIDRTVNGATEVAINGSELVPGLYMYHLTGDSHTASGKFVVE